MKIETLKYGDKEIKVPILSDEEIKENEKFEDLEDTIDLTNVVQKIGENDAR